MNEYGLAIAIWDEGGDDETILGYAEYTKGGMMFRYNEEHWGPTYDRTGSTPVDQVKVGESATAEVFMAEKAIEAYAKIFPAAKLITQGGKKKLVWGGMIGQGLKQYSKSLTLRPIENLNADKGGIKAKGSTSIDGEVLVITGGKAASYNGVEISFETGAAASVSWASKVLTVTLVTGGSYSGAHIQNLIKGAVAGAPSGVDVSLLTVSEVKETSVTEWDNASITLSGGVEPAPGENEDIKDDDITMFHAIPRAEFEFAFQLQQERIYKATFTGVPNDAGEMFAMGDNSISE